MGERLRVGLVGAGSWAREAHLPALAARADVDVLAVADIDSANAQAAAEAAGKAAFYSDTRAMLHAVSLDLVIIATPDDCHAGDAQAAIAAGCHVLCEKPLALTVAEARRVTSLAEAASVRTLVGFTLRFAPAVRRMKALIDAGAIGTPHHLQAFQQNGQFLDPAEPFHWKMDRARTGGGAIVEYGIHTVDLARWLFGEIDRVSAIGRTIVPERETDGGNRREVTVDDATAWLMDFRNGATGMAHASWATTGRPPGLELRAFGSDGAIRCVLSDDLPGAQGLWQADAHDQSFLPLDLPLAEDTPWQRRFQAELIGAFVDSIVAGTPLEPQFAAGAEAQAVLEALVTSLAESNRWVNVAH